MGKKGVGPKIIDVKTLIQAGIDPKTSLPLKMVDTLESELKNAIKRNLRIVDEQDAIRRYVWNDLPDGLDGELIERILYYKGQGMFFFMEENTKFYFLPFALDGEIDVYGRFTGVTPLQFTGTAENSSDKKDKNNRPWIVGLVKKPVYSVAADELEYKDLIDSCVLLNDYCKQMSQTVLPRQLLNEKILDVEAEMIPFMRTALQNQTGVKGVKVNNQDEEANLEALNVKVQDAALNSKKFLGVIGGLEFQELGEGPIGRGADYMQALESIDNFRLGLYGLENGGLFQKKAHMLEAEQALNQGSSTGIVYQDGLLRRQQFCDIVNSIWGLGISCMPSENQIGDMNLDGGIVDQETPPQEAIGGDNDVE